MRIVVDQLIHLGFDPLDLFVQLLDQTFRTLDNRPVRGVFELVFVHGPRLDELPPPSNQFLEDELCFVRHLLGRELPLGSELCQNFGVDFVGLGEDAVTFGEVADPCGINDTKRDFGIGQCDGELFFISADRFAEDESRRLVFGPLNELLESLLVVGKLLSLAIGKSMNIQVGFGDIDADDDRILVWILMFFSMILLLVDASSY